MAIRVKSVCLLAVLISLTLATSAGANLKGNLNVEVNGLRNQRGTVCFKLFSGAPGFPNSDQNAVKRQCIKITDTPVSLTFKGLTSGSYAVAVYHDANGNGKLDRNSLGMPTEGYGFSNNPIVRQAPPKFGDAVFLLAGPNTSVKIQMSYSSGG